MFNKMHKYFAKHVIYNSICHLALGIGIGAIISRPIFTTHPLRYGALFIALGLAGHLYPVLFKVK